MKRKWFRRRKRLFEILEVGQAFDHVSRAYDILIVFTIVLNLVVSIMFTYENMYEKYGNWLVWIEEITVAFFAIDYVLRLVTAKFLYPEQTELGAIRKYAFSFWEWEWWQFQLVLFPRDLWTSIPILNEEMNMVTKQICTL